MNSLSSLDRESPDELQAVTKLRVYFLDSSMRLLSLDKPRLFLVAALLTSSLLLWPGSAQGQPNTAKTKSPSCSSDDSGLTLPAGFCATRFADGIGHARHIAVASNGTIYVATCS